MTHAKGLGVRLDAFAYSKNAPEPLLSSIAFELHEGDRVCLLGASGCGKSTLLRILMGLERGAQGAVRVGGTEHPFSSWTTAQETFGLVPQSPLLFPWKTVERNLLLALPKGTAPAEGRARVAELLRAVGLESAAGKYPWQISLGMAARVSFARALLVPSQALLLDEPFAALDALTRRMLQDWLRARLTETRSPCVLVTHDVREALALGTRLLVLGGSPSTVRADFSGFENTPDWEKTVLAAL